MTPPPPPEKPMFDIMRLLPALVVGMGVLLVIGVVVFAWVAYKRLVVNPDQPAAHVAADFSALTAAPVAGGSSRGGAAVKPPLETVLDLPEGSRVEQLLVVGSRVVVLVRPSAGSDRLFVLDPGSGAVTGLVVTGKRPSAPAP